MTEQDLIHMGFKKKTLDSEYWYELKCKEHIFISNDTSYNNRKDDWMIGYQNSKEKNTDTFWFNENLSEEAVFKIVFHLLAGIEFKLAHQRKFIK